MRNVVLVTVDSVRADHCGYAGGDRGATPTLDAMADEGIAFENAIAPAPRTPESMPAIFTGSYPVAGDRGELAERGELTRRALRTCGSLAEAFQRAGYSTAGFTANGFTSSYFGYDRGFDHFEDFNDRERRPDRDLPGPVRGIAKFRNREEKFRPWESFYDELLAWVDDAPEPYFLWAFLMDTHSPYLPPRSAREASSFPGMWYGNLRYWRHGFSDVPSPRVARLLRDAYTDTIRYVDAFLSRLRRDLGDGPAVVFHADHGEAFGEHGQYGHGHRLYEENVRVPLVVSGADVPAETVAEPVSLRSLPALLDGLVDRDDPVESVPTGPVASRTLGGQRYAVRTSRWKLLVDDGRRDLFDLRADPGETDPVEGRDDLAAALAGVADVDEADVDERSALRDAADELADENL